MTQPLRTPHFGSVDELVRQLLEGFFQGQRVHFYTTFPENIQTPAVIARRERRSGTLALKTDDDRFMQSAIVMISTITNGPDADEEGEELAEMCRYALRQAQQMQLEIPGCGTIAAIEVSTHPSKVSDWQTASGPVQYASLPKNAVRYEIIFRLLVRPPNQSTITNRFMPRS